MKLDDTLVAVSSPPGAAPRGIVRLSGPEAVRIADTLFATASVDVADLRSVTENRTVDGSVVVEGVAMPAGVCLFRAPHSYTREDVVELHLLGAAGVLGLVVEACLAAGARRAEPGEFTARAYLAGAFDLSQVHAIAGMIAARSDHQLQAAERLLHGALGRTAHAAREELADLLSLVEGALDFADEPIEFISPEQLRSRLAALHETLESTAAAGLRAERWGRLPRVLLEGPPNAGKSSLLNRLTGLDRAICAPVAGTTRDVLAAPLTMGDTECLLLDAAGVCGTAVSAVETQARRPCPSADVEDRSKAEAGCRRAISDPDLILRVVDVADVDPAGGAVAGDVPTLVVLNKCDLVSEARRAAVARAVDASVAARVCLTSAATGLGCDALKAAIHQALYDRPVDIHDGALALMAEHREGLLRAIQALRNATALAAQCAESLENAELVAAELHTAAQALGTLVGEEQTEDMLGRIFSRFCIGK